MKKSLDEASRQLKEVALKVIESGSGNAPKSHVPSGYESGQ